MSEEFINLVYDTLAGLTAEPHCLPGVENAFAPGAPCDTLYLQAYEARLRICQRLGVDSDPDMEFLFHNMEEISRILGCKMFACGAEFQRVQSITPLNDNT